MFFAAVDIGSSIQQGLDAFFAFIPKLVGFLIVLLIGYIIARVVKGIVTKLLEKVGIDRALHSGSTGQYVNKVAPDVRPSSLIGSLAFWFLFLGAVAIAVSQLGIAALDNFVAAIGAYIPNIIAAVLIFVIAGVVAAAVGGLVARTMGDTPTGKVVGSVVPVLVMAIATFMILNQLQIASGDRDDHLRRADRRRVPRDGARLRPRRPRGRRPDALRRLRQGPGAARPGPS